MAPLKLLVLGATGPTGKLVVQRAVEFGWIVTVYGRRTLPEHAADQNIKALEGALDDPTALRTAIHGQDTIISVFGPSNPLASIDVFVPAYRFILNIMKDEGVKRIIALSTFSVYDPKDKPSITRWLLVTMLWAMVHKVWRTIIDVAAVFDTDGADLDWTLFRVGFLGNGPRSQVVEGYIGDGSLGMYLRRADIAEWCVKEAGRSEPRFIREKPGICSKTG
ncbi:hypothetical protein B0I35DRAFT_439896 [Stachybotrys elegans]|uniref:NAD(P)-binding domain-containing protein n=1 Tax=Stachybotrys elegans TaxID=80388 RepID=A0A8K0SKT4_9HYPO|nr:hypothetical protein B0I35DRAFT_439896 [Stachybotrys elegans]